MTNPVPQETTDTTTLPRIILGAIALLAPWLLLLFQLSITWETNEQYTHGYIVPILCLYMLVKADTSTGGSPASDTALTSSYAGKVFLFLGIPLMLVWVPLWIVRGANSDWRLLNLALFAIVFVFLHAKNCQCRPTAIRTRDTLLRAARPPRPRQALRHAR